MPTFETQQDFARRIGVVKSRVTKLRQDGRLVMHGKLVNAEASLDRVRAGADPARAIPPAPPEPADQADRIGTSYQAARAVRERYMALDAKRAYELACRQLVRTEEVTAAVSDAATTLRTRLESLPEQLATRMASAFDEAQRRAVAADVIEDILTLLSTEFGRIARP